MSEHDEMANWLMNRYCFRSYYDEKTWMRDVQSQELIYYLMAIDQIVKNREQDEIPFWLSDQAQMLPDCWSLHGSTDTNSEEFEAYLQQARQFLDSAQQEENEQSGLLTADNIGMLIWGTLVVMHQSIQGSDDLPKYSELPQHMRDHYKVYAQILLQQPETTAEDLQAYYRQMFEEAGWCYGERNDPEQKTDPCLCDFHEMDVSQKIMFEMIVNVVQPFLKYCVRTSHNETESQQEGGEENESQR